MNQHQRLARAAFQIGNREAADFDAFEYQAGSVAVSGDGPRSHFVWRHPRIHQKADQQQTG